jgi:DNA-binding Xre family transcriptional regulator
MTLKKSSKKFYKDEAFLKLIGKRMQELMIEKDITHEIFYNDTEINPHRHIIGKHNMTLSTFKRICDYLEVSPDEFMKGLDK